ncbi:hypothetical protein Esti_002573 [Eimeria stiedai]
MNLYASGGAPSQRGPYASRPPSVPLVESAAAAGYPQRYMGAPTGGEPPGGSPNPTSWGPSKGMEYQHRESSGAPPLWSSGAPHNAMGPPGAPSYATAAAAPQGAVWSSPFGFAGGEGSEESEKGGAFGAGDPLGAPVGGGGPVGPEQQVMNMVLHSVADNLTSQAGKQVSLLQQRFPRFLLSLRPYFSVSQGYVLLRLRQLLFPFAALLAASSSPRVFTAASDISNAAAAARTPERDMYIPLMALTTFVLLVCIQTGTQGGFYPELMGSTLSLSVLLLLFEVGALKLVFYFTGACAAAALDLLCFCGYKYVHVALLLLLRLGLDLLWGPPIAWWAPLATDAAAGALQEGEVSAAAAAGGGGVPQKQRAPYLVFLSSFIYLSLCVAAEVYVLLKRAQAASHDNSSAPYGAHGAFSSRGPCAAYALLLAAAVQVPLCWFLLPSSPRCCRCFAAAAEEGQRFLLLELDPPEECRVRGTAQLTAQDPIRWGVCTAS